MVLVIWYFIWTTGNIMQLNHENVHIVLCDNWIELESKHEQKNKE